MLLGEPPNGFFQPLPDSSAPLEGQLLQSFLLVLGRAEVGGGRERERDGQDPRTLGTPSKINEIKTADQRENRDKAKGVQSKETH